MEVDWKRIPQVLHSIQFEVVGSDSDWSPYGLLITPVIKEALLESSEVMRNPNLANMQPQKIRHFIEQYPRLPMFKNHLFLFYYRKGLLGEAQQVIDTCVAAHPDYFYNGIMQCMLWIKTDADRAKIPILMRGWNIVAYAGRTKFEDHEVRAYYLNAAEYHLLNMQVDLADQFVYFTEIHDHSSHKSIQILREHVETAKKLLQKYQGLSKKR